MTPADRIAALGQARALIDRLAQVVEDRMTTAGHPYALITQEHLGTCSVRGCSARCVTYRALIVEADRWLTEVTEPVVIQPPLFAADADPVAGGSGTGGMG